MRGIDPPSRAITIYYIHLLSLYLKYSVNLVICVQKNDYPLQEQIPNYTTDEEYCRYLYPCTYKSGKGFVDILNHTPIHENTENSGKIINSSDYNNNNYDVEMMFYVIIILYEPPQSRRQIIMDTVRITQ